MPAYSFQRQFAEPILAGTKGGTIRAARKVRPSGTSIGRPGGHARPGEKLSLYTGMRTKQCRLIAERRCLATDPIWLDFKRDEVLYWIGNVSELPRLTLSGSRLLDTFAVYDGFERWDALTEFWRRTPGSKLDHFIGWHIRWLPLPSLIDLTPPSGCPGNG